LKVIEINCNYLLFASLANLVESSKIAGLPQVAKASLNDFQEALRPFMKPSKTDARGIV